MLFDTLCFFLAGVQVLGTIDTKRKLLQVWGGSPAPGRSLCQMGGVETHRGGSYGYLTALSGVIAEGNIRVAPTSQDGLEGLSL